MVSHSVFAACGLAAVFSLSSLAQSGSTPAQTSPPAQTQPAPKLQLQDLPPEPHTPTPAEQQQQHDQAVLNAAVRLATMQAHWGPEMDSPGVSIALTETARTKTPQGTNITYRISGSGFAADEKLMLVRWPLNAEARAVMAGINFDAHGVAVCSDTTPAQAAPGAGTSSADALAQAAAQVRGSSSTPAPAPNAGSAQPGFVPPASCAQTMQPQQPVEIQVTAAQGEAVRVALMTVDRKHGAAASTIPFPLVNTDKGCKLQVILGMKDAALVLIDGTGFPANTPLKLQASTGDQSRELHPRANAEGHIVVPLLSGAKGQTSGETTIKFAGLNRQPTLDTTQQAAQPDPDCAPAVSFHWGDGSYQTE